MKNSEYMDWERPLTIFVLLIFLSGCIGQLAPGSSPPSWTMTLIGHKEAQNGTEYFVGRVAVDGNPGGVEIKNLSVEFADKNNNTLKTVSVPEPEKTYPDSDEINTTYPEDTRYIYLRPEKIVNSENRPYTIKGLEWMGERTDYEFIHFVQEDYDPGWFRVV